MRPRRGQAFCLSGSSRKGNVFTFFLLLQKEPKARTACFLGRGRRPDAPYFILLFQKQVKCSRKGTVLFFSLLRKEPKVAQRVATLWTPRDGSKLYRIVFFVIFPFFVPISVCGETHFFGCFEPVRKGYCSTDARLMFFENRMLYSKLTRRNIFKKGSCSLSLLRWEFVFAVC